MYTRFMVNDSWLNYQSIKLISIAMFKDKELLHRVVHELGNKGLENEECPTTVTNTGKLRVATKLSETPYHRFEWVSFAVMLNISVVK